MLKIIEQDRSERLRERMDEAGCVFQFVVLQAETDTKADEAAHRLALHGLYEQVMKEALEWHQGLLKDPQYANREAPHVDWASDRAIAKPVPASELQALTTSLYAAFTQPPYGTQFNGGENEAQSLFEEWIALLGLSESEQPEVIDWVANLEPHNCKGQEDPEAVWSSYFDYGLEWWGVWCLTIWNPKRRTFGALIASTTD